MFASKLGVQPLYFRPPYDIDEEPDTDDQAAPVVSIQREGYTIIGNKIDTDDWNEHPRKTSGGDCAIGAGAVAHDEGKAAVSRLHHSDARWRRQSAGDGGCAPVLIDTLRAHGYSIVPVSALMGKTTAEVMPPLTFWQHLRAMPDSIAFSVLDIIGNFIVDDLLRRRHIDERPADHCGCVGGDRPDAEAVPRGVTPGYNPRVAVLVPAYNEETVIVRTIRSVLNSDYKNLHVIVIDDGSYGPNCGSGVRGLCRGDCGRARAAC